MSEGQEQTGLSKHRLLPSLFPLIHKTCGKTAFYYREVPGPGAKLVHSKAVLFTGHQPVPGKKIVCGSCNEGVALSGDLNLSIKDLV